MGKTCLHKVLTVRQSLIFRLLLQILLNLHQIVENQQILKNGIRNKANDTNIPSKISKWLVIEIKAIKTLNSINIK